MLNPYALLGILIAIGGSLGWGTWEYGRAEKYKADYATLQASYANASAKAAKDAADLTAKRDAEIRDQGFRAASIAQQKQQEAEQQNQTYQLKLTALSKQYQDLGHRCTIIVQPEDTLPGL